MNTLLDGRYQILRKLGRGGFAATYLARNIQAPGHPTCVIKHLKPRVGHPKLLQLFRTEARVLDQLSHQQIPNSTECFERDGEVFMVQDFVAGTDLGKDYLRGRRWSEAEIRALLSDLLNVLDYVHQHQIIHRDIKPENIIQRQEDGRYVLIDFGAVKELQAVDQVTSTLVIGTAGYRSPEYLRGESGFSSDIYGLGITVIQLLTRTHPSYFAKEHQQIIWRDKAMVGSELAQIIDRMVCPEVADRYQTTSDVMEDLQQLPAPLALSPQHPDQPQRPALLGVFCILGCLLGITALYGISQLRQPSLHHIEQETAANLKIVL
jgi:eukaryotic-like serine/threonine-protein kinase